MIEAREHIEIDNEALALGYKNCQTETKEFFNGSLWMLGNFPSSQRRYVETVLHNIIRAIRLMELDSSNGLSLDVWHEIRDDLSDAFQERYTTVELAALIDTAKQFDIPKEFLFNPISGADTWIRNRKFETFEELETFASNMGGSSMAALVPVLGYVKPDYEVAAIECGKAIFLTQVVANCVGDIKQNKILIAQKDLEDCEVVLHRLKLRQGGDSVKHLVRLYCARIEKIFYAGGKLVSYLDFDAKRSVTSMLAYHWRLLQRMRLEPELILAEEGVLNRSDMLRLKSRHLLGLEGNIPILPEDDHHDH